MTTQVAGYEWEWIDDWGRFPDDPETRRAWPHAGMVVTPEDEVVTFHPSDPALVCFSLEGELRRTVPCGLDEAHGLTLVVEDGVSFLWASDATMKMRPHAEYKAAPDDRGAAVVKVALDGTTVMSLPRPTHAAYEAGGAYCPTNVAVDEPRFDGRGDIWVSDGYGSSLVHRFSADGRQISTLTGEEGAGRFDRPHAVFIDRRGDEAELWIADRTGASRSTTSMACSSEWSAKANSPRRPRSAPSTTCSSSSSSSRRGSPSLTAQTEW